MPVVQRQCGWCGVITTEVTRTNCVSCAGPLPALPASIARTLDDVSVMPAVRPPPPPRTLPPGYENRVKYWGNVYTLIGIIFTVVFCWALILIPFGIPLWIYGARWARRKLDALRNGQAAEGSIVSVEVDYSTTINNKHPYNVRYVFDTPQGTREGVAVSWDPMSMKRETGELVWVVYLPDDPDSNALWPPIK